jgi:hypothetical protein
VALVFRVAPQDLALEPIKKGFVPESRAILPLLFMQDGPSLGFLDYFFNPACQFVTTVSGGDAAPDALTVFTRNRLPSAVTSEILWRRASVPSYQPAQPGITLRTI